MIFFELSAWVTALGAALLMLLAWHLGVRSGGAARTKRGDRVILPAGRAEDATLALLGLLLAFSFSTAATKFERRKALVLEEATAIGDFSGAASVVAEPERASLRRAVHDYAVLRRDSPTGSTDPVAMERLLAASYAAQAGLAAQVEAATRNPHTPVGLNGTLVGTLNAATTAYQNRLQAWRDHAPTTIIAMLIVFAGVAAFVLGRGQGVKGEVEAFSPVLYVVLTALVLWVILDLEQPQRGSIIVPQTPLEELVRSLPAP